MDLQLFSQLIAKYPSHHNYTNKNQYRNIC